jgi:antitoxin (DNA-binding transcriptional repressor) of toxin-antitoxin stability system
MPPKKITVTEAVRNISDYIDRVACGRERFVLYKDDQPIAELRPLPAGVRLGDLPSIIASLPRLSEQEAEEFRKDIEKAREELSANRGKNSSAT